MIHLLASETSLNTTYLFLQFWEIISDEHGIDLPVNYIPVDTIFSPVRRVNYTVSQARVGQRTDYDALVLEVWTDGSIRPDEAISIGSKI